MRLIYMSPLTWQDHYQRPHHFVRWWQKTYAGEVLWIDPYPTRLPRFSDIRRIKNLSAAPMHDIPQWLRVLKPRALPIEPLIGAQYINRHLWKPSLKDIRAFAADSSCQLIIGKPSALALHILQQNLCATTYYDAMDNFSAFYTGLDARKVKQVESQIINQVETIITSAHAIMTRIKSNAPDKPIIMIPNGVNQELMDVKPIARKTKSHKVFGYVGTVASWFDWAWVIALAKANPTSEIRIIGTMFTPPPSIRPENITIKPSCSHAQALIEMQDFDVGIIPFKDNQLTDSVDPIKYYEYRSFGLPVLTTPFGEMKMRACEKGVFIANQQSDIPHLSEYALKHKKDTKQAMKEFVHKHSWSEKFNILINNMGKE